MKAATVAVVLHDQEDRAVEVRARYSAATSDYFDRGLGCYLPGDPEEVEVLSATALDVGANVDEVAEDEKRVAEAVREAAADDARDDGPDPDAEYERRRERAMGWD